MAQVGTPGGQPLLLASSHPRARFNVTLARAPPFRPPKRAGPSVPPPPTLVLDSPPTHRTAPRLFGASLSLIANDCLPLDVLCPVELPLPPVRRSLSHSSPCLPLSSDISIPPFPRLFLSLLPSLPRSLLLLSLPPSLPRLFSFASRFLPIIPRQSVCHSLARPQCLGGPRGEPRRGIDQ